jgi:hypothetical protein
MKREWGATVRRWFQAMALIVFGAPRLFSYQLIELYKQETEIRCRKDDRPIKK